MVTRPHVGPEARRCV